jgi:nucleotide-binding universal stress UspA family protein
MRLDRILVGMDFSAPAVAGAQWAAEHLAPGAELLLVNVVDLPAPAPFLRRAMPPREELAAAARDYAETRLGELARSFPNAIVRAVVKEGRPHEALADAARELDADLIVVGPHGDRPRPWKPLGTTAGRLVRVSPVPVLVATEARAAAPRRVLAPVDGSDITTFVLSTARWLAERFGAEVTVVHVLDDAVVGHVASLAAATGRGAGAPSEQLAETMSAEATRWLEALALHGPGSERVSAAVTFGDAPDAILALAETVDAELIVMGRRGAGALRAAVLGSTVSTVLQGAHCPVLVVSEPEDALAADA